MNQIPRQQNLTPFKCVGSEGARHPKLKHCFMVDQRFATVINNVEHSVKDMDENAEEKYFMFATGGKFNNTEECQKAIKAYKCALTIPKCLSDPGRTHGIAAANICRETCDDFFDVCYSPEMAELQKSKNCIQQPTKEDSESNEMQRCTSITIKRQPQASDKDAIQTIPPRDYAFPLNQLPIQSGKNAPDLGAIPYIGRLV